MTNTKDFAIISEEFSNSIFLSFGLLYCDFIKELGNFCNNVRVLSGDKIINKSIFRKIQFHNKYNVIYSFVAYYDVSDFVRTAVPNVSKNVKIAVLQKIIELGGIVIVDGKKLDISDLKKV